MRSINPATEEVVREYVDHTEPQVRDAIAAADDAFRSWRKTPMAERAVLMRKAAGVLRSRAAEFARLMTLEMGKPIVDGEKEIEKCALCCEHFADHAAEYLNPQSINSDATESFVRFDPLGAVLAIMPWNFPFWQLFRFAAPSLMAGNTGLLKHAENVPGCALACQQVFEQAGFPKGVFTTLLIDRDRVEAVIRNDVVKAVTLTGSERAGKSVAATAGSVLKKCVLELGGSDPFIVFADADLDAVAKTAAEARCINSGQSCIAAKRFLVEAPAYADFVDKLASAMQEMTMGDPLNRQTQIGPQARDDLRQNLHRQVEDSIGGGARLVVGGKLPPGRGFFYPPTVLADVAPGMPVFDEETFGPVAAVTSVHSADEAIEQANRSQYGLGASIWTSNIERARHLTKDIESGCVFINGIVKSDPRLPFGGVKNSGYGRELAAFGIHEFTNIKTVWVK